MNESRTAVVTGAASGIGRATARTLSAKGYRVIGVDRAECTELDGSIVADLSTLEGVDMVIDALPGQFDTLCNIAGLPGTAPAPLTMAVNVNAMERLMVGLEDRLPRDAGSIVNLASLAGSKWAKREIDIDAYLAIAEWDARLDFINARQDLADDAYRFSKECVIVASARRAAALAPRRIRVNTVSPGPVETPILEDFKRSLGRGMIDAAVEHLGRAAQPEDIAGVVAFLGSEDAQWVTGVDIKVDGGIAAIRAYAPEVGL